MVGPLGALKALGDDAEALLSLRSGAGTLALALAGARLFGEAMGPLRWASAALIVAGVVGLNVFG